MTHLSTVLFGGLLLLTGCTEPPPADGSPGTGSGGSGTGSTTVVSTQSTAELSAPVGFTFSNQSQLTLQIDLPGLADETVMLNLCFPQSNGAPDRLNCILRTTMNDGRLSVSLDLAAHQSALVLELRARSNLTQAMLYSWDRDQGNVWQVNEE